MQTEVSTQNVKNHLLNDAIQKMMEKLKNVSKQVINLAIDYSSYYDPILHVSRPMFLVPATSLIRDVKQDSLYTDQIRPYDKAAKNTNQTKNELQAQGQKIPIAVKNGHIKTGNGRRRSISALGREGKSIPNLHSSVGMSETPPGYIWVYFIDDLNDEETFDYQVACDTNHSTGENLTRAELCRVIQTKIERGSGVFKEWSSKNKKQQEESIKQYITNKIGPSCVHSSPKSITSITNKLLKESKSKKSGIEVFGKPQMADIVFQNLSNLAGIYDLKSIEQQFKSVEAQKKRTNLGFVIPNVKKANEDGTVNIAFYGSDSGAGGGASFQSCQRAKYIDKKADVCILLVTFQPFSDKETETTRQTYDNKIENDIKTIKEWNDSLGVDTGGRQLKSIDHIIYVNQITDTQDKQNNKFKPIYKVHSF